MAAPPPPPPPPLPSPATLRKGTYMGGRPFVPERREQAGQPKGCKTVCGTKLPELVFPKNTEERAKGPKVFRFLKPPTPSPESAPRVAPHSAVTAMRESRGVPAFEAGPRLPPGVIPPPPPLPPLSQPGAGATRKWAPVQLDEPGKTQQERPHMGTKLPELVFPSTPERGKIKVFRFLKPPMPSPENSASCGPIDRSQPPCVYPLPPTSPRSVLPAQTSPAVVQNPTKPRPPPVAPKPKVPKVVDSADIEQLNLRSQANLDQQQATESREYQSQQTRTTLEPRATPAARTQAQRASTDRQVAWTLHDIPARHEDNNFPYLEPPTSPQGMRQRPQGEIFVFPPQQAPQLQTTTQPQKQVPRPPRFPAPPKLRLGPHKYATPDCQDPPAPCQ